MEGNDRDRIDQWLDGALNHYGEREPRLGLETRILARLRAEQKPLSEPRWWPVLAAAAAVLVIGAAIVGLSEYRERTKDAEVEAPMVSRPAQSSSADRPTGATVASAVPVRRKFVPQRPRMQVTEAEPKMDVFPAPLPLSEQEKVLVSYVEEHPREAQQLAQAQAALMEKDLKEFIDQAAFPKGSGKSSE